MRKGAFDLEDLADQLKQMEKIGGMSGVLGMLPGIGKMKKQIDDANLDDKILKRQRAIISSMTPKERRNPKILDGKRKRRIAAGSGTKPEDVNKLLKMHRQMADMMKTMGKRGGMMQRMMGGGAAPRRARPRWSACRPSSAGSIPRRWRALPKDLKEQLPKGLPRRRRGPAGRCRGCPACPGCRAAARRVSEGSPDCREEEMSNRGVGSQGVGSQAMPASLTPDSLLPDSPLTMTRKEDNSMSVKIRLSRGGTKKRPYYYIVVADIDLAARWPLHRADRHPQPAAAQGQRRPRQARPRARQALAVGRRAADRPRARASSMRPA